jgi:ABC-2 type transport system permease protein
MAGLNPDFRQQLRAIANLRLRLFLNSLRSIRGRLNLLSRSIGALMVLGAAIGGGLGLAVAAWGIVVENKPVWLDVLFWLVLLFWQLFPVMATAFTESIDASSLLRFPLNYPSYFVVRLMYGALDIATALGLSWSVGLFIGITVARPKLAPWTAVVMLVFAAFNILLARMIFVWIEHWLSRRRSREVLGVIFLLMMIGFQTAGPLLGRFGKRPASQRLQALVRLIPAERLLPPGLASSSLGNALPGIGFSATGSLLLLLLYATVVFTFLDRRLRAQYRGENPPGAGKARLEKDHVVRSSWRLPGIPAPIAAVYEKELRYFSRSGPMLFTLIMPLIMVFILWGGRKGFLQNQSGFVFPIGAAYCLLILTNIVYNSFGGDGGGIQFFFVSPASFRQILIAKNLAQLSILLLDMFILWLGVRVIFTPPRLRVLLLTLAWYLFAAPLNFMAGNLLSIYTPKRIDYATFGRQRAAETTILASFAVQLSALGIGAVAVVAGRHFRNLWVATAILFVLAIPSLIGYFIHLRRIDGIAMRRREVLASELCRA